MGKTNSESSDSDAEPETATKKKKKKKKGPRLTQSSRITKPNCQEEYGET